MTTFKKCFSPKANLYFIACYEDKAVYLAKLDGKIYKQIPLKHFVPVSPEDTEFPGDYAEARQRFKTEAVEIQRRKEEELANRRRNEARRLYNKRKNEVLFVRNVRNAAWNCEKFVPVYNVMVIEAEYDSDNSSWNYVNPVEEDNRFFYKLDEAERYYESLKHNYELLSLDVPHSIEFVELYRLDKEDVLDITDYESMMDLLQEHNDWEEIDSCTIYPKWKSIEGAIIVKWSWEPHVGYAREFHELRRGWYDETEENLITGNEDSCFRPNLSLVLWKEDIEGLTNAEIRDCLEEELLSNRDNWRWSNPDALRWQINVMFPDEVKLEQNIKELAFNAISWCDPKDIQDENGRYWLNAYHGCGVYRLIVKDGRIQGSIMDGLHGSCPYQVDVNEWIKTLTEVITEHLKSSDFKLLKADGSGTYFYLRYSDDAQYLNDVREYDVPSVYGGTHHNIEIR